MKNILITIIATLFVAGSYAQSSTSKMENAKMENSKMSDPKMDSKMQDDKMSDTKMQMKDGVMMMNNKAMLWNENKFTALTKTYTCTNGCKVSAAGIVTKADGTKMKLMNGSMIGKDGMISMIPHGGKGHLCNESCAMHSKM